MVELTIETSILEPRFVGIGVGAGPQGLRSRLGKKIGDHLKNLQSPRLGSQLNHAAKAAVEAGWLLEVSWAETTDSKCAKAYEAALISAYFAKNGHLPNFKSAHGVWETGNQQIPNEQSTKNVCSSLDWTGWKSMDESTNNAIPCKPGVYRIRAVPPGA